MALLKKCLCCSLLTGAVLSGVYATAVYIVAFAVEVWLITETRDEMPIPSYVLCVTYFLLWTLSVALLVGLALRRTKPMLAWLLTVVVLFFPECGLVLFMSLYHWTLETSVGSGELIFWVARAVINVLGLVCVYSLYCQWKEEKNVVRRLRDLNMTSPVITGEMKTPLPGSLRAGYLNSAYVHSQNNLRHVSQTGQTYNQFKIDRFGSLHRSASTLSEISSHHADQQFRQHRRHSIDASANANREFNCALYKWPSSSSAAPGLTYGSMGIAGVGLGPADPVASKLQRRAHSLLYIDDVDGYWAQPPLSRPVSTALILGPRYPDFFSPGLDRQSQFIETSVTLRRAHSMSEISTFGIQPLITGPDVTLQKMVHQPFSYLKQVSRSSLGQTSDDLQRYKDVAL